MVEVGCFYEPERRASASQGGERSARERKGKGGVEEED